MGTGPRSMFSRMAGTIILFFNYAMFFRKEIPLGQHKFLSQTKRYLQKTPSSLPTRPRRDARWGTLSFLKISNTTTQGCKRGTWSYLKYQTRSRRDASEELGVF
jgi:hypothetical protein